MTATVVPFRALTHMHVTTDGRDCDGRIERDYVWTPIGMSVREAFTWQVGVLTDVADGVPVRVERGSDEDGCPFVDAWQQTEEGYHSERVTGCGDERCDREARRYRDHTAERAGY